MVVAGGCISSGSTPAGSLYQFVAGKTNSSAPVPVASPPGNSTASSSPLDYVLPYVPIAAPIVGVLVFVCLLAACCRRRNRANKQTVQQILQTPMQTQPQLQPQLLMQPMQMQTTMQNGLPMMIPVGSPLASGAPFAPLTTTAPLLTTTLSKKSLGAGSAAGVGVSVEMATMPNVPMPAFDAVSVAPTSKLVRLEQTSADFQAAARMFAASWIKPHITFTIRDIFSLYLPATGPRFEAYCAELAMKRGGNANVQFRFHGCGINDLCMENLCMRSLGTVELCNNKCSVCGICKCALSASVSLSACVMSLPLSVCSRYCVQDRVLA